MGLDFLFCLSKVIMGMLSGADRDDAHSAVGLILLMNSTVVLH